MGHSSVYAKFLPKHSAELFGTIRFGSVTLFGRTSARRIMSLHCKHSIKDVDFSIYLKCYQCYVNWLLCMCALVLGNCAWLSSCDVTALFNLSNVRSPINSNDGSAFSSNRFNCQYCIFHGGQKSFKLNCYSALLNLYQCSLA